MMGTLTPPLTVQGLDTAGWAALLTRFYIRAGLPFPVLDRLKGREVPQPYRELLVHSKDMTATLEAFYGERPGLVVLSREIDSPAQYVREVLLTAKSHAVEYGVIRILLDHFPLKARRLILDEERPLGGILQDEGIGYISWPQAFFRVHPDPHILARLRIFQEVSLYGRRNVLLDASRRLLAEVIEVLAPA